MKLKTCEYSIDSGDGYSIDMYAIELPTTTETRILMFSREFEDKKLVLESIKWDNTNKWK